MTKRLKTLIYSSVGIVSTIAIITPVALTYTNKGNNSSINKTIPKILSQQNINNSNFSNLSSNWINDKNKTNHNAFLFTKENISFISSATLKQISSNLDIVSTNLNYLAITVGIIASIAIIISSISYIEYDAIASQVNQLPNSWLTGYNTLSTAIKLGHTFSTILEATTNALDCFGKWAIAIPIFGEVVNILNAIINNLYS